MSSFPYDLTSEARLGAPLTERIVVPLPPIHLYVGFALPGVLLGALAGVLYVTSPSSRGDGVLLWGALLILSFVALAISLRRRLSWRFSAQMFTEGFTLDSKTFRFDEVESLSIGEKFRLSNGKPIGIDRRFVVRGARRRVEVRYFSGRTNPLAAFMEKLIDGVAAAAARKMQSGIRGTGWQLDLTGITTPGKGTMRFDEIGEVGMFDTAIRIWRRGGENAFLSVPADSENAVILLPLLENRIQPGTTAPPASPASSTGGVSVLALSVASTDPLGRLLFVRQPQQLLGVLTGIFGGFTPGIPFFWMSIKTTDELLGAVVMTIVAPLCLALTLHIFTLVIRFHEHAVVKKSVYGSRTLRYESVEEMTWAEAMLYVNGGYAGTSYTVKLRPSGEGKPLGFTLRRKEIDADLATARGVIATHVAAGMERVLASAGRAPWGATAWITRDALELRRKGKDETFDRYPWAGSLEFALEKGELKILQPGPEPLLHTIRTSAENFFPGLVLVQKLVSEVRR